MLLQYNGLLYSHFLVSNQIPTHVIVDQEITSIEHILLQYSTEREWIDFNMIGINEISHVRNPTTS